MTISVRNLAPPRTVKCWSKDHLNRWGTPFSESAVLGNSSLLGTSCGFGDYVIGNQLWVLVNGVQSNVLS